jgi:hypothetical protein
MHDEDLTLTGQQVFTAEGPHRLLWRLLGVLGQFFGIVSLG